MTKFVTIVGVPPVSNFDQTTNPRFVILSTQPIQASARGRTFHSSGEGPTRRTFRWCWQSGGCSL